MTTPQLQAVQHRLMPVLRTDEHGTGLALVEGHLQIGLGLLGPDGFAAISDDDLLTWDQPFLDLVHTAMWNLRRDTHERTLVAVDTVPGMFLCAANDGLAASRLLCLEDLVRPWPLEGVVVACPRPDQLLVVPLDGLSALPALRILLLAAQDACSRAEHPLSDQLFWYDGDDWALIPVEHVEGRVDVDPGPAFVAALERLTAVGLVPEAAEA